MPFITLQIHSGSNTLKPWYGCMVGEASTVADAFTVFSSGSLENGLGKGKAIPDEYHSAHIDGHHKVIRWRIIVHSGIDGYSRLPVRITAATNNRTDTVLS